MKKKAISLLLTLVTLVGIMPTAAQAKTYQGGEKILGTFILPESVGEVDEKYLYYNQGDKLYAPKDAKEWYAYTVDTLELDLGDIAVDGREAIKKTVSIRLQNVGNMPITFINDTYDFAGIEGSPAPLHHYQQPTKATVNPGESTTVDISLEVYPKRSYGKIYGPGYFTGYIGGHRGNGLEYTVKYNIVDGKEGAVKWQDVKPVGYGEVSWRFSEPEIDFGDVEMDAAGESAKILTVANTGIVPIEVRGGIVASGVGAEKCESRGVPVTMKPAGDSKSHADAKSGAGADDEDGWTRLASGQNAYFLITPERVGGRIEGINAEFEMRYTYDGAEYTYTELLPVFGNILRSGGFCITNATDGAHGTLTDLNGSAVGGEITIEPGDSYTVCLQPAGDEYYAKELWVDGANLGAGFTEYTFSSVSDDHTIAAVFDLRPEGYAPIYSTPASWAKEDVRRAFELGILTPDLCGDYKRPITRSEFCKLAYFYWGRVYGNYPCAGFGDGEYTDTDDPYVSAMSMVEVINGYGDGRFDPDRALTREQAATILARLVSSGGIYAEETKTLPSGADEYADSASVSSWAVDSVDKITAAGIMNGMGDNTFAPKGQYTREQAVVTIMRLYDWEIAD